MASNPRVFALLEEMLDSGRTAEEVCRDCPELLPEVKHRWQAFRRVDEEVAALLPESATHHGPVAVQAACLPADLPQIPGYRVEAVLGHGGMGVVYRAWHLGLDRAVALKMLLAGPYARPEERERLRREAQAVAALCHPNIVQVYDVGDVDGRPYFTMELIDGGNLADKTQSVPQPARQAAALVATIADAIHAAHQAGIVHRDLKPSNILLTDGRHAQGDGLWSGAAAGRRQRADRQRRSAGYAELHGPRAGARQQGRHRTSHRCVRPGSNSLRAAHGPAAVPGREPDGDAPAGGGRRSGPAGAAEPARAARPGNHLPEVLAQGAAEALRQRRGTGRRPPPVPSRGAHRGAPGRAAGAPRPVGAAEPGGRGAARRHVVRGDHLAWRRGLADRAMDSHRAGGGGRLAGGGPVAAAVGLLRGRRRIGAGPVPARRRRAVLDVPGCGGGPPRPPIPGRGWRQSA